MKSHVFAGDLQRRIKIQLRDSAPDSFGAPEYTWTDVATVWANVQPLSGKKLENAKRVASEVSHEIVIRYNKNFSDTKVASKYRVIYRNRILDVHAILNDGESDVYMSMLASEGVSDS